MELFISVTAGTILMFLGIWFTFYGFAIHMEEHDRREKQRSTELIIFLTGIGICAISFGIIMLVTFVYKAQSMLACG